MQKILCVDDSADNCELLTFILSNEGYQIETASSVAKGLQAARNGSFVLYLIDLTLADGSGIDLILNIREFDSSTPIAVCSGDGRESVKTAVEQAGVQAFLLKPIDPETLVEIVVSLMSDRQVSP
ncbi:MAG: response regulator [Leptolyngbyaceae cyanobacterium bins.349]|nr:response regulator [Leptolyngbyaceae cyanobacterium bins.349]